MPENKDIKNMTPKDMLEEINSAIKTVLVGGQSYKIGTRRLNRADLSTLYKMQKDYEARAAETDSPLLDDTFVSFFEGR